MTQGHTVARGGRGLLCNHPSNVVMIVNGEIVTTADILKSKRARQQRELARKRRATEPVIKPAFVCCFYCPGPFFMGWHTYIRTRTRQHWLTHHRWSKKREILEAMRAFPCGCLPFIGNLHNWMPAFARRYASPTRHAPDRGLAYCWVKVQHGDILAIYNNREGKGIPADLVRWSLVAESKIGNHQGECDIRWASNEAGDWPDRMGKGDKR